VSDSRDARFRNLSDGDPLDAMIVGGGMTGAPIYHELCSRGYRVALIDKGDFSSGTSQASGMLVWGGLLYLRNLDFPTVLKLCRTRKALLKEFPDEVAVLNLRYRSSSAGWMSPATVWLILQLYWLLGACSLDRPSIGRTPDNKHPVLNFQEAMLRTSDSRFVIDRIRAFDSENCLPLNYCRLVEAGFDRRQGCWKVVLRDERTGIEHMASTRTLIIGAGVWTDEVNRLLALESPFKHVFSKGVYVTFPGVPAQSAAHVYPMHDENDVLTHVPWGPVMMWGPTETKIPDIESGLVPSREDIRFLLDNARRSLPWKPGAGDVISIRCGIRPLAVPRKYGKDSYPLDLSRRHRVVAHEEKRALSIYGGKLTSSMMMANHVTNLLARWVSPRLAPPHADRSIPELTRHRELHHDFVTPEWARDHEFCLNLEDYVRRRTTIAQWTPRMGLERNGSGRAAMEETACAFARNPAETTAMVDAYEQHVRTIHDPLLEV
jgi:glycerol-3-phosphate dehydrogenase